MLGLAALIDIGPVRPTIGWHVSYLTNFYLFDRGSWHGSISHLWSLAVEEQFYLVWPFLVLWLPERRLPMAIVAMVCLAPLTVVSLVLRAAGYASLPFEVALDFGVSLTAAWIVGRAAKGFAGRIGAVLTARPVTYAGTISYGLYLYHGFMPYVLGRYVTGFMELSWPVRFTLLTMATFTTAAVSWRLFEAPILKHKDRLATAADPGLRKAA